MRFFTAIILAWSLALSAASSNVTVMRAPDGGIQPQAAVDRDGAVHLIYFKGKDAGGDIFYVKQRAGETKFSKPMRVNSRPGSAMAVGSIRGAQLALGKNGRVHVIWNGAEGSEKAKVNGEEVTPLVYTRLNDAGAAFEPERNLLTYTAGLDGGSSIAADQLGNVYAFWHGRAPGAAEGEAGRAVFFSRSTDEGKTFGREKPATAEQTGACGCCGMKAFADANGAVYVLYRAANEKVNRDEVLLVSDKPGAPFTIVNRHPWRVDSCPMSAASITSSADQVVAAWETAGKIYYTSVDAKKKSVAEIKSPAGDVKRRHPIAIANSTGETLVAWSEGTAWARGGTAVWEITDNKGGINSGRGDGLPVWSVVTGYAKPNGDFVVIY